MSSVTQSSTFSKQDRMAAIVVAAAFFLVPVFIALQAYSAGVLTYLSLGFLLLGSFWIVASYRLTADWISPPVLLSVTWAFTLFLATFDVQYTGRYFEFNDKIVPLTWCVCVGSVFAFIAGCTFGLPMLSRRAVPTADRDRMYRDDRVHLVIHGSFSIALAGYLICFLSIGEIPIFTEDVNAVRRVFRVETWGLLMSLFMVTVALASFQLGRRGFKGNLRLILPIAMSLFLMLSTTQRADSFQAFVISGVAFLFARRKFRAARVRTSFLRRITSATPVVAAGVVLAAAFLYVGSVRSGGEHGVAASEVVEIDNDLLAQLYIYSYVPSIKNFQWGCSQGVEGTGGVLTMRAVMWFIGQQHVIPEDLDFGGVNTTTWLWYYYRDFGYLGVIAIPFLLGLVTTTLYGRAVRDASIASITLYGLSVSCVIWTAGTERFFEPLTAIYACLFIGTEIVCRTGARQAVSTHRTSPALAPLVQRNGTRV